MNNNTVFLLITVYNSESYIADTIKSIIEQTYKNWELVIIDDGSTDKSLEISQYYEYCDSRITVITQNNTGQTQALYNGMQLNNHPYFGWVDSDDILHPLCLQNTVRMLDADVSTGMVYTEHTLIDNTGTHMNISRGDYIPYSPERLLEDFMTFHFRLIRTSVFENIGGICLDENINIVQDYNISLKISEVTKILYCSQILYYYRIHASNITRTKPDKILENVENCKRNALVRRGITK